MTPGSCVEIECHNNRPAQTDSRYSNQLLEKMSRILMRAMSPLRSNAAAPDVCDTSSPPYDPFPRHLALDMPLRYKRTIQFLKDSPFAVNAEIERMTTVDSVPIYQLIQDHFQGEIASGALPPGSKLPTEKEIARQFSTSRATVQNAMSRLVYAGQIEKRVGSGTFVAETARSATMEVVGVKSFEEDVSTRGEKVQYRLINLNRDPANANEADALEIDEGTPVLRFERLRLVGGSVIGLERRTFTQGVLSDISLDALDRYSTHHLVEQHIPDQVGRMEASIRAVVADDAMAAKLDVASGAPLLRRSHRMFSQKGRPILLGEAFYCEPFAFRYTAHSPKDI